MFKTKFIFIGLVLLGGQAWAQGFHFKRKVIGPDVAGWYALPLPADMYRWMRNDFSDIRIYHVRGVDTLEVPYLQRILEDEVEEMVVDLPVFNKSKKGNKLFFTTELTREQKVNQIDLAVNEDNFNGFVQLEGSADQQEWFKIDSLHRILSIHTGDINFQATALNFPMSSYRYLRVGIDADKPLTFASASFKKRVVKDGTRSTAGLTWGNTTDKKRRQTEYAVNLDAYQPIDRIVLTEEHHMDFYRPITIEILRDSIKTQKGWVSNFESLYSGYVTSLDDHQFNFPYRLAKKLRITVYNGDNPPLDMKSITASGPQIQLIAQWQPGDLYIFYGKESLGVPSYDLAHFKDKIPADLTPLSLGPAEDLIQPIEKQSPLFESKLWLWALMGVIIAVLGYFTMKMMTKN